MRHSRVRLATILGVVVALLSTTPSARQASAPTNITSIRTAEFFTPAKVWTASLTMSAESWEAMQPGYGASGGGFGGGFGGGARFLGPPGGRNGVAARQGIEFDYVHATLQLGDWTFPD